MADNNYNQFSQNIKGPQYGVFGRNAGVGVDPSSLQFPQVMQAQNETLPSTPIPGDTGNAWIPNIGPSGGVGDSGGGGGIPWTDAMNAGLSAFGKGMQNAANASQEANKTETSGAGSLAQAINQQEQMAQNGSQNAMQYMDPSKSITPFSNMAIKNALIQALGPNMNNAGGTINVPGATRAYMPTFSPGPSLAGVKQSANQYMNDDAIRTAMDQYQQQITNIDPYAKQLDLGAFYGPQGVADTQMNQQAQAQSQQRRASYEQNAQQALKQAIAKAQDNGSGGIWSSIGSGLLAAAPYVAMAL